MSCAKIGCERDATHVPEISVPRASGAKGLTFTIGAQLCRDHARDFPLKQWITAEGLQLLLRMAQGMVLDADKATVRAHPIATISDIMREKMKIEGKDDGQSDRVAP